MDDGNDSGFETDSPLNAIATGAAMVVGFGVAGALLALNVSWWWVGMILVGGLVPLFTGVAQWYEDERTDERQSAGAREGKQAALDELRERYARGDLTDAEFESRVERLLETETVADARDAVGNRADERAERERTSE